ncbi:MAG: hypothetical protein QF605_11265, partial [Rhodospirillales bacterium]|nr:hypothetical protein [Rhodospirillales bacterium]
LNIAANKGPINGIFFKSFTSSRAESSTDVTSYFSIEKIAVRFQKRQFRSVPSSGPTNGTAGQQQSAQQNKTQFWPKRERWVAHSLIFP